MAYKTLSDSIVEAANSGKNPPEIDTIVSGATIANGTTVANITDAVVAHALNATFSDTEVEAALGLVELDLLDRNIKKRQANAKYLNDKLRLYHEDYLLEF